MLFNFQVITLTSTIFFSSHISYPSASEAMDDPDAVEADPVPEADVEASHDHVDPNVEAEAEDAPEAKGTMFHRGKMVVPLGVRVEKLKS